MIYFGDHDPSAPLATPMVLWQLHSTLLILDKDTSSFLKENVRLPGRDPIFNSRAPNRGPKTP